MERICDALANATSCFVDYQPIVSLENRTLIGFEALVRWRHPEFGLVPPKDFIQVAEETGQILTIRTTSARIRVSTGARVADLRIRQAPPLFVSVNLSVKQFNQPGLVETSRACCRNSSCRRVV
jgi:EAL domain-containing protein (putative c-di-GMP-specific phosphodiesterase class I)